MIESEADWTGFGADTIINLIGARCLDNAQIEFVNIKRSPEEKTT